MRKSVNRVYYFSHLFVSDGTNSKEGMVNIMEKHFKLILPDEGADVYMPRQGQTWGYRYGPSIMVHDGICEAWFASPGDSFEADWFTYRRSEDGGKTWSYEKVVMAPTPDSMDWFSVCDPAVIKFGGYYYIGYTSTLFKDGGGVCNNAFVARSKSPTGPFLKWTGSGWGETRTTEDGTCTWIGKPAPVIYYDEVWQDWGAGEFSFVVKGDTLYMYYTWTASLLGGGFSSTTRVASANINDENWPGNITLHGVASVRRSGSNDSYDMVYCEDLDKFIALSTDRRFSEGSMLAVYESNDGLKYRRVNDIKVNTSYMLHNCGISGDELHHIKSGDLMILGYAYGNQWGKWGTRFHRYSFEAMDEDYYSEEQMSNVTRPVELWPVEKDLKKTYISLEKPHYIRVHENESKDVLLKLFNVCYDTEPIAENVEFSNYDTSIIEIDAKNMKVKGKKQGYTYVDARYDDLFCEFLVYVYPEGFVFDDPNKTVVSFTPMLKVYNPTLGGRERKQIRGMARYSDDTWYEICEKKDNVKYAVEDESVITVDENGVIYPVGACGKTKVRVSCENHEFEVEVVVSE